MRLVSHIQEHGLGYTLRKAVLIGKRKSGLLAHEFRNIPVYKNPTSEELETIEKDMRQQGLNVENFSPSASVFHSFKNLGDFPENYHGGADGGVYVEKVLEHWLSHLILNIADYGKEDVFVDVAAAASPWAKILREKYGIKAFANDLGHVGAEFRSLDYYRSEDATKSAFGNCSVRGLALHCAFEMFVGDHDIGLIREAARILQPGGKLVILPLYTHTHYCAYATPEYYNSNYSDTGATRYVRLDSTGIASSRKYDVPHLRSRIVNEIERQGMSYRILVLRNAATLGEGIYLRFVLEVTK